jgi:hypothetical protein
MAMEKWRVNHPEDVPVELDFWHARRTETGRGRERRRKGVVEAQLVGPLTIENNDDKWLDLFLTSDEDSVRDTS